MKKLSEYFKTLLEQHPYKQNGNRDSYSQYNEGWQDALDLSMQLAKTIQVDAIKETAKECVKNIETCGYPYNVKCNNCGRVSISVEKQQILLVANKLIKEL